MPSRSFPGHLSAKPRSLGNSCQRLSSSFDITLSAPDHDEYQLLSGSDVVPSDRGCISEVNQEKKIGLEILMLSTDPDYHTRAFDC